MSKLTKMFSIIIPLYNKRHQIETALSSVLAQTYTDYEVIIVDDGSTDGSAEVVDAWLRGDVVATSKPRNRITLISQLNAGVSAARNRGIAAARGEFIALLDADDEWKPDYLATVADMIARYSECDVFATNYEFRDAKGETKPTILRKMKIEGEDGVFDNYFEVAACSHPPLWTSAVVARKSAYDAVGGFPVGIKSGEDLLTWARLRVHFNFAYSIKPKAIFNVEGLGITEKPKRQPDALDYVGDELVKLIKMDPSIRLYVSMWHKMLASVYLRNGHRKLSIQESLKGLKYNPGNWKLMAYIIINCLPFKIVKG